MNSILSKLNAQLEKYNNGCGICKLNPNNGTEKILCGRDDELCFECQAGKSATERAIEIVKAGIKEFREDIKKDMFLMEDARDILINLKEQGVGIGDCENIFDKRVKELKETLGKIEPEKENPEGAQG